MSLITDVAAKLDTILADPALTNSLRAACPGLDAIMIRADAETARHQRPAPQPLPAISLMTALQLSYFDNGKASGDGQFVITIEAFQNGVSPVGQGVKLSSPILTRNVLQRRLKRWRVENMDDWRDTLLAVLDAFQGPEWQFVPLTSKAQGTTYFQDQLVVLRMDGKRPVEARLFVGGETLTLTEFSDRTSKGKKLKATAKSPLWSCRYDATGDLPSWATQTAELPDV